MFLLWQGCHVRYQGFSLSSSEQPYLEPNVKRVKAIVDGSPKYIYACTRCLRSGKVTRAV